MYSIPTWSAPANQSLGPLYRELQDVEIYVEDQDSEAIYTKLLQRAVNNVIKIKKIIPLNGRSNVIDKCKTYTDDFPALFIIDGDLDIVYGERESTHARLFQHRLYCLENYLFCEKASAELLQNASGRLMPDEAIEILEWQSFKDLILGSLLELFKVYAVSKKLAPELKTVSTKYHTLCIKESKKRGAVPCSDKINHLISDIRQTLIEKTSEEKFEEILTIVTESISELDDPMYAISGKDYLLKALRDYLSYKGASLNMDDGFKFQLSRYCDISPLNELAEAIITTASGTIYNQVS